VHVDLLMPLTVKKNILHVKLRDSTQTTNRGHHNKSMNSGPMRNKSKSLLIVTIILLLKTASNKTHFIALNRAIRVVLIL
jgi:hypothetical protein